MLVARKHNISVFLLVTFFISSRLFAQNVNINIFSDSQIEKFVFSVVAGKYEIIANKAVIKSLEVDDTLIVSRENGKVAIVVKGSKIGPYDFCQIRGIGQDNVFSILPLQPKGKTRVFDDDIYIQTSSNALKLITDVDLEKYVAGVIESEAGFIAPLEYYKVQSILCRTYAVKYFGKHLIQGYNLCDKVHCQAYRGKCVKNPDIIKATRLTKGMVLVDSSMKAITATFYSNSGGQTVNSEDVWSKKVPYLQSITDSFSLGQPNAIWEKKILKQDWVKYLAKKGIKTTDSCEDFYFVQNNRKNAYTIGDSNIPLKNVRTDWYLKSTYFSIIPNGDTLIFKGKGFGHGVGLSQEGAMQMARLKYSYDQIINYYFKNVSIRNIKTLHFFEVE